MEKPSHHEICDFDEGAEVNVTLYITSEAPVVPFGGKEKSLEKVLTVCFQTKFDKNLKQIHKTERHVIGGSWRVSGVWTMCLQSC